VVKQPVTDAAIVYSAITACADIDLLVDFSGKYDFLDIIGLKRDLEEVLGCKVDLLTFNSLLDEDLTEQSR
jgi:predicted nucleotidyltransferase